MKFVWQNSSTMYLVLNVDEMAKRHAIDMRLHNLLRIMDLRLRGEAPGLRRWQRSGLDSNHVEVEVEIRRHGLSQSKR